jgi:hypothetical protein
MTARPYYSPSALAVGERCPHAWALCYLDGLREPSIDWADIEAGAVVVGNPTRHPCPQCGRGLVEVDSQRAACPVCNVELPRANSRQRGASVGSALHAHLEEHYRGGEPDWTSTVGEIAAAGLGLLPRREACVRVEVEHAIGDVPTGCERPPVAMLVHGVPLGGFRDLVARPDDAECARLRATGALIERGEPLLVDYKGTSNVANWAKSTDTLRADTAACAYALDVMRQEGLDSIACRWVYFQTKNKRAAKAVDFRLTAAECERTLAEPCRLARELDAIESSAEAPRNTRRCTDFLMPDRQSGGWQGGCEYHCTAGGPCDARRSLVGFFHLLDRLEPTTMTETLKSKFAKKTTPAAPPPATEPAPPPVGATEPPPAAEDTTAPEPTAPAEAETPKQKSKQKRNRRTGPAQPPPTGDAASFSERQAAAREKIAEGEAELAAVNAEIQAAAEALAALLPAEAIDVA